MAAETTSTLSNEMMTYYESKFLERAKHLLVHEDGATKNTHAKGQGKNILFNRYSPLATATTPLTEGSNPSEVSISSSTVTASLQEYGNVVKISKLIKLTSIDKDAREKVELMGQNMGETLDELARDALYSGATAQLASGASAVSGLATSDTMDADEARKAVRYLESQKALKFGDGFYKGIVGPYTKYDLIGDNTWVNAKTYSDVKDLYRGEIGELYGVRFALTTNQKSESSTATVYSNFIMGDKAFGTYDLEGDMPKLYIKVPGKQDTSNPTDRYSTIGWAGTYVARVLISTWCVNVKTGATA